MCGSVLALAVGIAGIMFIQMKIVCFTLELPDRNGGPEDLITSATQTGCSSTGFSDIRNLERFLPSMACASIWIQLLDTIDISSGIVYFRTDALIVLASSRFVVLLEGMEVSIE